MTNTRNSDPVLPTLLYNTSLQLLYFPSSSSKYTLHYLSRFPIVAPASLEIVRIHLGIPAKDKVYWEGVDTALNDSKFSKLRWFEIEGPIVVVGGIENFFQVVLPKSYLRGLLWVRMFLPHERCE